MFLSGFPFFTKNDPERSSTDLTLNKSIRIFIRESDDGGDDRIDITHTRKKGLVINGSFV